jgi:hypothetical protein
MPAALFCAACRMLRPVAELLAFWPRATPARIRYVCRPSLQRDGTPSCFREMVGNQASTGIALATDVAIGVAA